MDEDLENRLLLLERNDEKMLRYLEGLGYAISKQKEDQEPQQQTLENLDEYNLPRLSDQALGVLKILLENDFVMKLDKLSGKMNKNKVTVFGLLEKLQKYGFVNDRKGGVYEVIKGKRDWLYGRLIK